MKSVLWPEIPPLSLSLSLSRVTETDRKQSPVEEEDDRKGGGSTTTLKKKKKKSNSLVRKLSLNKFRLSTEQEPRHTPEGGDNSRPQSQSSQESPSFSDSSSGIGRKRQEVERLGHRDGYEAVEPSYDVDREKGEPRKPEKQEKLVSSVTVVQSKSPSFTIRSFNLTSEHGERSLSLSLCLLSLSLSCYFSLFLPFFTSTLFCSATFLPSDSRWMWIGII